MSASYEDRKNTRMESAIALRNVAVLGADSGLWTISKSRLEARGFSTDEGTDPNAWSWAELLTPEGTPLVLSLGAWNEPDRIKVSMGQLPGPVGNSVNAGGVRHSGGVPSCTLGAGRETPLLLKDIKRRMLDNPDFRAVGELMRERVAQMNRDHDVLCSHVRALTLMGFRASDRDSTSTYSRTLYPSTALPTGMGTVQVDSTGSAYVDRLTIPAHKIEALLALLRA